MVDAEIRYFMDRRRDEIKRAKIRKLKKDETLDKRRYVNFKCKLLK